MSEIAIITCGGTIDKTYGTGKNIYNFEIRDSAIPNLLSLRAYNHTFIHVPLLKKDSLDETTEDRETIRATIEQLPQEYILITHGTDSMIQTAKHLEGIGKKTIVLVGASIPYVMKDSDAEFNIGFALGGVLSLAPGVYVAMGGGFFSPDIVTKNEDGTFTKNRIET